MQADEIPKEATCRLFLQTILVKVELEYQQQSMKDQGGFSIHSFPF